MGFRPFGVSTFRRLFPSAFIGVYLWFLPSLARADAWADLASGDPAIQQAAYDQLAQGDAGVRRKLADELATLRKQAWFDATRATQSAAGLFGFVSEPADSPRQEQFRRRYETWQSQAQGLRTFMFDARGCYQVPGGDASRWRPGVDVQPGQEDVERLTEETIQAWNALQNFLQQEARREGWLNRPPAGALPASSTGPASRPAIPVYAPADPRVWVAVLQNNDPQRTGLLTQVVDRYHGAVERFQRYQRQIDQLGIVAPSPELQKTPAPLPPLVTALAGASTEGTRSSVLGAGTNSLTDNQSKLLNLFTCGVKADLNPLAQVGGQVRSGWHSLQLYRLACGVAPLRWNEKLARAATEQARDMQRLNFFSHHSPVPGKATLAERAGAAGFYGPVGECLDRGTLGPQGENAVWRWRADAEHHRLLLSEAYPSGAIGAQDGVSVLMVGREGGPAATRPETSRP